MLQTLRLDRYPFLAMATILLGSYAIASLSWHLLEKPFLRLKRFFESKPIGNDSADNQTVVVPH
jgi:peptidoglycan/LPS O-acetylase OafA/YrhL